MTPKKIKIVNVEKNDYKVFLKKAKDFYDIMLKARDTENWTAVGLNAVHCAISCCDAISTFHLGIRSAGQDHIQAFDLLLRLGVDHYTAGKLNSLGRMEQAGEILPRLPNSTLSDMIGMLVMNAFNPGQRFCSFMLSSKGRLWLAFPD